jgi:hypothetical protein
LMCIFGGSMQRSEFKEEKYRDSTTLLVCSRNLIPLVHACKEHIVLKKQAADIFWNAIMKTVARNSHATKEQSKKLSVAVKKTHEQKSYHKQAIDSTKITKPYLAGLFDGDGNVGIYQHKVVVRITQRSSPMLLVEIQKLYPESTLGPDDIFFQRDSRLKFLNDVQPYCVVKHRQVVLAIEILKLQSAERGFMKRVHKHSENLVFVTEAQAAEISRLKHLTEPEWDQWSLPDLWKPFGANVKVPVIEKKNVKGRKPVQLPPTDAPKKRKWANIAQCRAVVKSKRVEKIFGNRSS